VGTFLYRRLLGVVPLLLGVVTLVFVVLHVAPGDATAYFFRPGMSQSVIEQQRHLFGLDRPIPVQYLRWLGAVVRGDLGYSLVQGRPVRDIIAGALPATVLLTGTSLVLVFLLGVVTGVFQAARHNRASDGALGVTTLFFYSMPAFWLGTMLMLVFALKAYEWGWPIALPPSGMTDADQDLLSFGGRVGDVLVHLVLPVATLTLTLAAGVARYTRAQMLEVVRMDYIRTARAKGVPERTVFGRHALRNSLLPVITLLGLYVPFLFSGTVLVERVFAWPGMGTAIFDAILSRDYPVVMAASLIFAALTVLGNLLADILYAVVDPRVRVE